MSSSVGKSGDQRSHGRRQRAAAQQHTLEVVEPEALAELLQGLHRVVYLKTYQFRRVLDCASRHRWQ